MVTYSGGVDSSLLSYACLQAIPDGTIGFMADIPYLSMRQRTRAFSTAEAMGLPLLLHPFQWDEMKTAHHNDDSRCYHCKDLMYYHARETGRDLGIVNILDGENADDREESRPGRRAATAHGIISPLRKLGFQRQDVEKLVLRFQLPITLEKETCLATRISGIVLSEEMLSRVEDAEASIRSVCPLRELRLRLHCGQFTIQVRKEEMEVVLKNRELILLSLMGLGIHTASLSLLPYESHR